MTHLLDNCTCPAAFILRQDIFTVESGSDGKTVWHKRIAMHTKTKYLPFVFAYFVCTP
jgi:hypothetical protein